MKITISQEGYNPVTISTESNNDNKENLIDSLPESLQKIFNKFKGKNIDIINKGSLTIRFNKELITWHDYVENTLLPNDKENDWTKSLIYFANSDDGNYLVFSKHFNRIILLYHEYTYSFKNISEVKNKNYPTKPIEKEYYWSIDQFVKIVNTKTWTDWNNTGN